MHIPKNVHDLKSLYNLFSMVSFYVMVYESALFQTFVCVAIVYFFFYNLDNDQHVTQAHMIFTCGSLV